MTGSSLIIFFLDNLQRLNKLCRVKEIQGSAGVHIILDPQLDDIANTLSCFDIRLPYSDYFQRPPSLINNYKLYSTGIIQQSQNDYHRSIDLKDTIECQTLHFFTADAIGSATGPAAPLIVVRITSRSGHQVEVAVIPSKMSSCKSNTLPLKTVLAVSICKPFHEILMRDFIHNRG